MKPVMFFRNPRNRNFSILNLTVTTIQRTKVNFISLTQFDLTLHCTAYWLSIQVSSLFSTSFKDSVWTQGDVHCRDGQEE